MLRQPDRGLKPSSPVIKSKETSRKLAVRQNRLQLVLWDIVGEVEQWAETVSPVPPNEEVDVTNVVWHEDYCGCGLIFIKPLPDILGIRGGGERV